MPSITAVRARAATHPKPTTAPKSTVPASLGLNKPLKGTDVSVMKLAAGIVRDGGTGRWFISTSPFDSPAKKRSFFVVTALPNKPQPTSPMLLLRTQPSLAFLGTIIKQGAPLILGTIPLESQVTASALGKEYPLAGDALKAIGDTKHAAGILVQPDASKFVVAHEFQHWKDFESPTLDKSFMSDMKHFMGAKYLTAQDKSDLMHLMWELRGHNAQLLQAEADKKAGLPVADRAGNPVPSSKRDAQYDFEIGDAQSIFMQAYQTTIIRLVNRVRAHEPAQVKNLASIFSKYDLSTTPGARLSFAKLVPPNI